MTKEIKLYQYDTNGKEIRTEITNSVIINREDGSKVVITTIENDSNKNRQSTIETRNLSTRGKRREANLFEESSEYSNEEISEIFVSGRIKQVENTLNDLGIDIKNEDNTYKNVEDILYSLSKMWNRIAEQQERQSKMDKLEELCKPIAEYLRNNCCPYDSIVITDSQIRLVSDKIGIPVNVDSEKEAKMIREARITLAIERARTDAYLRQRYKK